MTERVRSWSERVNSWGRRTHAAGMPLSVTVVELRDHLALEQVVEGAEFGASHVGSSPCSRRPLVNLIGLFGPRRASRTIRAWP
jgi:hypothetical protein